LLTGWHCAVLVREFTRRKPIEVTAHRAGGHGVPENTLAALRKGIKSGAAFAEIDVQETADGVVVVVHDQDLRRLGGVERRVADLTLAQLKAIDVGKPQGNDFAGEHLATLEEFIDEATRGCIKLNIELKYYGRPGERLAREVVRILRDKDFLDQAVITSLNYDALAQVRRLEPRIPIGFIVAAQVGDLTRLDLDFLSINKSLAKPELLARAAKHGRRVHVWTVDHRKDMVRLLDRGVDNLISDEPELAVEVVAWYQSLTDLELFLLRFRDWLRG
jgi:glycerophosphoryl diester phosphodiesterase